ETIDTTEALDEALSRPSPRLIETFRRLPGDVLVLGAGGKMGPTLARMARRAADEAGVPRRVLAVSRFSRSDEADALQRSGVEVIRCDLLDRDALDRLPDAPNIIYMAGMKFG